MEKDYTKEYINLMLKKSMKLSDSEIIPNVEKYEINEYNEAWVISIAVDMVSFGRVLKKFKRFAVINLLQSYVSTTLKIGKENTSYISSYTSEDVVVMNFAANKKSKILMAYLTAIEINSAINLLLASMLKDRGYKFDFRVGIGIWLSNHNSLVKYGSENMTNIDSEDVAEYSTMIGESMYKAKELAKIANREITFQILMNDNAYSNLSDEDVDKDLIQFAEKMDEEIIYGTSARYPIYEENGSELEIDLENENY